MRDWWRVLHRLPQHLLGGIWSILFLLQIALALFVSAGPRLPGLWVAGWAIWALGSIFAVLPILTLRRRGGVPGGKSYMETTTLVDSGIYAIVRHPQGGTAGILLTLALALIGQHWLVVVVGAVGMLLLYIDTYAADEACIKKFGPEYAGYMRRVPRVNFVAGILRLLRHPQTEGVEE